MNSGRHIRLHRLLASDGKTVIAALDHGIAGLAPLEGLESPDRLIPAITAARIDAVIVTPGIAGTFSGLFGKVGLIVRVDCGPTAITGDWSQTRPALAVEDAVVVVLGGSKQSPKQLITSTREARAAGAKGVAVGRNIWQSPDPGRVVASLVEAVHG